MHIFLIIVNKANIYTRNKINVSILYKTALKQFLLVNDGTQNNLIFRKIDIFQHYRCIQQPMKCLGFHYINSTIERYKNVQTEKNLYQPLIYNLFLKEQILLNFGIKNVVITSGHLQNYSSEIILKKALNTKTLTLDYLD